MSSLTTPISFNGVYARKLTPNEDYTDGTKMRRLFGVATGERDEHLYEVVNIWSNKHSKSLGLRDNDEPDYSICIYRMKGEIFSIADSRTHTEDGDLTDLIVDGEFIEFRANGVKVTGVSIEHVLTLTHRDSSGQALQRHKYRLVAGN